MSMIIHKKLDMFFNNIRNLWGLFGLEITQETNRFVLSLFISFIVIILTVISGRCKRKFEYTYVGRDDNGDNEWFDYGDSFSLLFMVNYYYCVCYEMVVTILEISQSF